MSEKTEMQNWIAQGILDRVLTDVGGSPAQCAEVYRVGRSTIHVVADMGDHEERITITVRRNRGPQA